MGFINPSKIIKAIQFFKRMNNPFFKDVVIDAEKFMKECKDSGQEAFKFQEENNSEPDQTKEIMEEDISFDEEHLGEENDQDNLEEKDFKENDVVRKFQFDYNASTCFEDNMPEISAEDNKKKEDTPLVIAPGEGKIPTDYPDYWEAKAFPSL